MADRSASSATALPTELRTDLDRAGYYPALVADVVDLAVAGEPVRAHLVHQETTFDRDEVRRHVTVLVLTPTRLVLAHADEHPLEDEDEIPLEVSVPGEGYATAATEAVPLHQVRSVVLSHVVANPGAHRVGDTGQELTLTIGWGAVQRLDLEPATCGDPDCEADHGYTGSLALEDIAVRVSADADGSAALRAAMDFARELSAASASAIRG